MKRRTLLQGGSVAFTLAAPGLVGSAFAQLAVSTADWNKAGFEAKTAADAIRHLGSSTVVASRDIVIDIHDVIENGARTRIEVTSRIPNTQALSIITDRNPYPLAATFHFANGADPYVSTLIKVAESGTLRVIVSADGRLHGTTREVKTTIGGCG
ncbi:MAG: thiosulfate oxidation carrier protein SoxY [Proteobacteria bacterium]|nr:thiosulfate oxidation carrier protein SoxY [Pseudomonadota bacterium]